MSSDKPRSDALVFFGATGNLAYKKIYPALQAMAKKQRLDFPDPLIPVKTVRASRGISWDTPFRLCS
jgi:glucose-6-phosphate 1-dehydrogenase